MDLQLYRVDDQNYLVDFRNFGYYPVAEADAANGAPAPATDEAGSVPGSVPGSLLSKGSASNSLQPGSVPKAGGMSPASGAHPQGQGGKPMEFGHGVSGPFHFLEMACQLIAELASG